MSSRPCAKYPAVSSADDLVNFQKKSAEAVIKKDADILLEELRTHQVELEMQNLELKEAQRDLEESRDRYAELYDFAPVGYATLDAQGCILGINLTGASIIGVERAMLAWMPLASYMDKEGAGVFLKNLALCRKNNQSAIIEVNIPQGEGAPAQAQILIAPASGSNGRPPVFRATITDISRLKAAEEEKSRIQAQLLQSQKMEAIGKLASGIAHDFNNLMTVISSYCGLAMREDRLETMYGYLGQISASADRAKNLTRQLLIFSSNQPIQISSLDVNGVITGMLDMLSRLIGEDISVETDLEAGLLPVRADKGSIEQLIMNIVINARDSMPKGGNIVIRTENVSSGTGRRTGAHEPEPGDFVCLTIEDAGSGMTKEVLARIFEPFFTTKRTGEGMGLGLTVVDSIIKQHKGWLDVTSEPGHGSIFKVCLPASKEEPKTALPGVLRDGPRGNGERILMIEDEKYLRKSLATVLAINGYSVFAAGSAQEAIDIFEKENGNFQMVFSDIILQDRNGIDLVQELLSKKPGLRVLFTSGYMDVESQWSVIQEKGFKFLQKPYEISEILRMIRASLV